LVRKRRKPAGYTASAGDSIHDTVKKTERKHNSRWQARGIEGLALIQKASPGRGRQCVNYGVHGRVMGKYLLRGSAQHTRDVI